MKKIFLIFSIISCVMTTFAQSSFYVYKTDGSSTEYLVNEVDSISFIAPTTGIENGYEWVDLGLLSGLKWATCNVGATKPEEYGNYYAWGETTPKSTSYDWNTYKWCKGSYNTMTKYCTDRNLGTVDNKTILDKEDDAAAVNMGGSWRMPTKEEIAELIDECTWTWTTLNGVNGYNVEGPNGTSIFLPAAGYRDFSGLGSAGSDACYWSSSLYTNFLNSAYDLSFNSDFVKLGYPTASWGYPCVACVLKNLTLVEECRDAPCASARKHRRDAYCVPTFFIQGHIRVRPYGFAEKRM